MAQMFNIPIANGGGWPLFNMHTMAGLMNGWRVEFHLDMQALGEMVFVNPPRPENNIVKIASAPGLGLTNRQLGELYASYRASSAAVRRKIVQDPALFLKARAAAKDARAEAGLYEKQERCVKILDFVGNVSLGLMRSMPEALNYDTPEAARGRIRQAWTACRERS